ncbi:MAG: LOG family protein [Leptolyngbyaceae cyanobacterium SL_1_1]|nr:LOG family protein [Leptolyngbyaceae cyanobacterium SL_1_1]
MLDSDRFRVAIFGSARIHAGDSIYEQVRRLARLLGREGMDVVTGGGPGLMEAANRGHKEGRADPASKSYGLSIKLPFEEGVNDHVDIKREFDRFSDRLDHFMSLSNAVVVAPGGVGTLLEMVYTWQLMQVEHICNIPIILVGEMWADLLAWVRQWPLQKQLIDPKDYELLF